MSLRTAAYLATLTLAIAGCALQPALAADSAPTTPAASDRLAGARAQIKERNWSYALEELERIGDRTSADWNNLMGYTLRKQASPDLDAAERHYNEALHIDPKHRGALEYSGELYLMKGDLARAEQRLATLDKACTFGCEQYTELKAAIERYKSTGKYVAASR